MGLCFQWSRVRAGFALLALMGCEFQVDSVKVVDSALTRAPRGHADTPSWPGRRAPAWPPAIKNRVQSCDCDIVKTGAVLGSTSYPVLTLDGASPSEPISPGALICTRGQFGGVIAKNLLGTAAAPIRIAACGPSETRILKTSFTIEKSRHLKVSGCEGGLERGFVSAPTYSPGAGSGVAISDDSSDYEIAGFEIHGLNQNNANPPTKGIYFGIRIQPEIDCNDPSTQRGAKELTNIFVHDNTIHHIDGPGVYFGHYRPLGATGSGDLQGSANCNTPGNGSRTFYPLDFRDASIYRNYVHDVGAQALRFTGVVDGLEVFDNVGVDYAMVPQAFEDTGLAIGPRAHGKFFNNTIVSGHYDGFGAFIVSEAGVHFFNNLIIDPRAGGIMITATDPGTRRFMIDHNTIVNFESTQIAMNYRGGIGIIRYTATAPGSTYRIFNNLIIGYNNALPAQSLNEGNALIAAYYRPDQLSQSLQNLEALTPSAAFQWLGNNFPALPFQPVAPGTVDGIPLMRSGVELPSDPVTFDFNYAPRTPGVKPDIGALIIKD